MNRNFVKCPICGKELKEINWRHLKTHNTTKEDILKIDPNFQFRCDEFNDRVKKINREISNRDEVRNKRSSKMRLNYEEGDLREKTSKASKKMWQDEEYRNKVVNGLKESHKNPEVLNKIIEANKLKWSKEEYKLRVSSKIKTTQNQEEKKAHMREKSLGNWEDEKYLEKQKLALDGIQHTVNGETLKLRSSWEKVV
jgi:DNA-binding XRE family transcriptional regulator